MSTLDLRASFVAATPCAECGGRERYAASLRCVGCVKAANIAEARTLGYEPLVAPPRFTGNDEDEPPPGAA